MKKILLTLAFVFVAFNALADECINWPKTMVQYDINKMQTKKTILLQSFDDFTKIAGDDWLSYGIPWLLADYLNTGRDVNAFFDNIAKYHPSAASPDYIVSGMFQHTEGKLRIFVKLNQGGEFLKQWQLDMPFPQNKQLFDMLGETAKAILAVSSPRYDNERFAQIKSSTPSMPAYQNYIRGLTTYQLFDPNKFEIIKTWFDESKKADINYQNAYKGMIDLLTFTALYNKQHKKSYSSYLEQAEKEVNAMEKFSRRPPLPDIPKKYMIKTKEKPAKLTNRFLIGNSHFVAGLSFAGAKQWLEAATEFEHAVTLVPEDAITWYHLSQMRERTGDKSKAAEARSKAFEIDRCLQ